MPAFAAYRMPWEDSFSVVLQESGSPSELESCSRLSFSEGSGRLSSGFAFAPFCPTEKEPILLIHPEARREYSTSRCEEVMAGLMRHFSDVEIPQAEPDCSIGRDCYSAHFRLFHERLTSHSLEKIVLARHKDVLGEGRDVLPRLFAEACRRYPRLFVAVVFTEKSGIWLVATPEILLERNADEWHTIALAGTMRLREGQMDFDMPGQRGSTSITWKGKDKREQALVADYIGDCLKRFSGNVRQVGPRTVRAAGLVHLCSDFNFTLFNNTRVGELLEELHPTPAVCGLPKRDSYDFILSSEGSSRSYYSGFLGPVNMDSTRLFVTLRCMSVHDGFFRLYAGGGLMADSDEEQEWLETEAKMHTMLDLLD